MLITDTSEHRNADNEIDDRSQHVTEMRLNIQVLWGVTQFRLLTLCRRNYFFLILAHPVYKM